MSYSKYGNRRIAADGYTFDSAAEYRRYCELRLLETAGEIEALSVHPSYELVGAFTDNTGKKHRALCYEGDFRYRDGAARIVVEDVKGMETAVFKIKRKLFLSKYPNIYLEVVKA